MKMIMIFIIISGLLGCCTNISKNNHSLQFENSKAMENIMSVKYINKNKGITKTYNVLKPEELSKLIDKLIEEGKVEPGSVSGVVQHFRWLRKSRGNTD